MNYFSKATILNWRYFYHYEKLLKQPAFAGLVGARLVHRSSRDQKGF